MRTIESKNLAHNAAVVAFIVVFGFVLMAARRAAPQTAATTTNPDHQFALKAASGGMSEVKLGQLAQEKRKQPCGERVWGTYGGRPLQSK